MPTAFEAIDRLCRAFPLVKLHERAAALAKAAPVINATAANLAVASIGLDLAEQCAIEGDYTRANALLELANTAAGRAKSRPMVAWIASRAAALRPFKAAYDTARPAELQLARAPDDPDANLVMGKFVAFVKQDFDAGLLMLVKGNDPAWRGSRIRIWTRLMRRGSSLPPPTPGGTPPTPCRRIAMPFGAGCVLVPPGIVQFRRPGPRARRATACRPCRPDFRAQKADTAATRRHPSESSHLSPLLRRGVVGHRTAHVRRGRRASGLHRDAVRERPDDEAGARRAAWLGASVDPAGRWRWTNGAEMFFSFWSAGEPSLFTPEAHSSTSPSGAWTTSTAPAGFICEWDD